MARSRSALRRFLRTPKGLLIGLLAFVTVFAAASEGPRLVAPGLAGGVLAAMLADAPILRWRRGTWVFPDGALLTGLIVSMILSPHEAWWIAAVTSVIAIASKHLLRVGKANAFNPAALALVVTFYLFDTGHSWWGSLPEAPPVELIVLFATGIFITDRVNKTPLVLSFFGGYYLLVTATAFLGQSGRVAELYRVPDLNAALFFAFFMLTDPPTSPPKERDQVVNGLVAAVVSFAAFEFIGAAYFLLAGLLAANAWEAFRRWNTRRPAAAAETLRAADEHAPPMNRHVHRLAVVALLATTALTACATLRRSPAGPYYLLATATDLDTVRGLATLPAYPGLVRGRTAWYIVTESSDRADAARRGVTWSPRLQALAGTAAVQRGRFEGQVLHFDAGVDFAPDRSLVANADSAFPPSSASPGSLADPFYTPFVHLDDGTIINAPIVANEWAALDRVERLDPLRGLVRLRLSRGYATGQTVWYTSTEASDPAVAAMERATFAPALRAVPGEGMTNAPGSARTGILAVVNGETGADNPERQGLRSAIEDQRAPLNVLEHSPDPTGRDPVYSPAWDLHLVRWTAETIGKDQRGKIFSWPEARALLESGAIVADGPADGQASAAALRSARVLINCPVIATFLRQRE